jgi:hypothetical protein
MAAPVSLILRSTALPCFLLSLHLFWVEQRHQHATSSTMASFCHLSTTTGIMLFYINFGMRAWFPGGRRTCMHARQNAGRSTAKPIRDCRTLPTRVETNREPNESRSGEANTIITSSKTTVIGLGCLAWFFNVSKLTRREATDSWILRMEIRPRR